MITEFTIVSGDSLAIIRVRTRFHLVDEVAHGQRMVLRGAKDQRLFSLADLLHEQLYAVRLALLNLDDLIEILLRIAFPGFNLAFHHLIVWRVHILVERCGDLLYAERGEESVVDAVFERVLIDRFAEIDVGIRVLLALRRGGQAELNSGSKILHDAAPIAFIVGPAAMALVDNDEIKEIWRVLAEIWRGFAVLRRTTHEGLEDGEEQAGILRNFALLADVLGRDSDHGILRE